MARDPEPKAVSDTQILRYPDTDQGAAEVWAALYGHAYRYTPERGWLSWESPCWRTDKGSVVRTMVQSARRRQQALLRLPDATKARQARMSYAIGLENAAKVRAALELAENLKSVRKAATDFDLNPWLFAVGNGILDLRKGMLRDANPSDLISLHTPILYDEDATCPHWEETIADVTGGDQNMAQFLQRAQGYSMTASTREQCFFIEHGEAGNGKTTVNETLKAVLGEYAVVTDFSTVLVRKYNEGPRPELAALVGRRLVLAAEPPRGAELDAATIKGLTGGDTRSTRELYKPTFEFVPTFKIWLCVNHLPRIGEASRAMFDRVKVIPFSQRFRGTEREDKTLRDKLQGELPGILRWCLAGCLAWQREGLGTCGVIQAATDEYEADSDIVTNFLEQRCEVAADGSIRAGLLYGMFQEFCKDESEKPLDARSFGQQVGRSYRKSKSHGVVVYHGLKRREQHVSLAEFK